METKSALGILNDMITELEISTSNYVANHSQTVKPISDSKAKETLVKSNSKTNKSSNGNTANTTAVKAEINLLSIDLRVGVITKVEKHPTADKLYIEEIDVGEAQPRAIASGLVPHYTLEEMQNRRLIAICNLKPRTLVGFKSHGMVLCAVKKDENGNEKVEFLEPPATAKPGDRIIVEGLPIVDSLSPSQVEKQKAFEFVAAGLIVDEEGFGKWSTYKLITEAGEYCTAPTVRNGILR